MLRIIGTARPQGAQLIPDKRGFSEKSGDVPLSGARAARLTRRRGIEDGLCDEGTDREA